jgi:hypothetical protein
MPDHDEADPKPEPIDRDPGDEAASDSSLGLP